MVGHSWGSMHGQLTLTGQVSPPWGPSGGCVSSRAGAALADCDGLMTARDSAEKSAPGALRAVHAAWVTTCGGGPGAYICVGKIPRAHVPFSDLHPRQTDPNQPNTQRPRSPPYPREWSGCRGKDMRCIYKKKSDVTNKPPKSSGNAADLVELKFRKQFDQYLRS